MNINKLALKSTVYPDAWRKIDLQPKVLYHVGASLADILQRPAVAIVGCRSLSIYGEQVTRRLARELAEQGIVIISGLAPTIGASSNTLALNATLEA